MKKLALAGALVAGLIAGNLAMANETKPEAATASTGMADKKKEMAGHAATAPKAAAKGATKTKAMTPPAPAATGATGSTGATGHTGH